MAFANNAARSFCRRLVFVDNVAQLSLLYNLKSAVNVPRDYSINRTSLLLNHSIRDQRNPVGKPYTFLLSLQLSQPGMAPIKLSCSPLLCWFYWRASFQRWPL